MARLPGFTRAQIIWGAILVSLGLVATGWTALRDLEDTAAVFLGLSPALQRTLAEAVLFVTLGLAVWHLSMKVGALERARTNETALATLHTDIKMGHRLVGLCQQDWQYTLDDDVQERTSVISGWLAGCRRLIRDHWPEWEASLLMGKEDEGGKRIALALETAGEHARRHHIKEERKQIYKMHVAAQFEDLVKHHLETLQRLEARLAERAHG